MGALSFFEWMLAVLAHQLVDRPLDFDRAADGVHDAAKLDDRAIAGALDDAPMMGGYGWIDEIAAKTAQARERAIFVRSRKPRVADNIRDRIAASFRVSLIAPPPALGGLAQMPAQVCPNAGSF
jgi:hypothetical protein